MIHKKANFGNTKGIMICEFGKGTIIMNGSGKGADGRVVLAFKTADEPGVMHVVSKTHYESFDKMKPELVFMFEKAESIDRLISILNDCKADLLK